MTETRITLTLDPGEARALVAMAQADCRQPRDQVKRLIRSEAEKRGLWTAQPAHEGGQNGTPK